MAFQKFTGTGVALVTPFNPDNSIDYTSLGEIIERQIAARIDYIVVMGTTAETPTLSPDERRQLSRFIVEHVNHRARLVLGLGGNDTANVIAQLQDHMLDSYDAVLSVTPYYNKPTQRGLYSHYRALADASPLPIVLYNVPSRTGVNLAAETTLRLASDAPSIIGVKEASGNFAQVDKILCDRPDDFAVISGDDAITLPLMALGADGVISVLANAFPCQFTTMVNEMLTGSHVKALEIHRILRPLFPLMGIDGNPAGIKSLMSRMGLIGNNLRLPLVPVSATTDAAIAVELDKTVGQFGEIN